MPIKMAKNDAEALLPRLDKMANYIHANWQAWGCSEPAAREMVGLLDKLADEIELGTMGPESLQIRQTEMVAGPEAAQKLAADFKAKRAQVLQRDSNETYMDTFKNPMAPIQTEGDEPYMKAYGDDQSSAVIHGESTTGRDLAPGHALEAPS